AHIARATLEGVAFQVDELLSAMKKDSNRKLSHLKVDGGAAENAFLMQFQADLSHVPVIRSQIIETTALGAALQAGLGIGFWSDLDEVAKKWKTDRTFQPQMSAVERKNKIQRWEKAIKALKVLV
ncbi:glycerol kinase, partial [bacterium]|nr:glycerol kinase [bacterium]